jgi:hypothetical protein
MRDSRGVWGYREAKYPLIAGAGIFGHPKGSESSMSAQLTSALPHSSYPSRAAGAAGHASPGHTPLNAGGSSISFLIKRRFAGHREFDHHTHAFGPPVDPDQAMVDWLFLSDDQPHAPADVFDRLRWGGQVVYVSRDRHAVEAAAKAFAIWQVTPGERGAWVVEEPLGRERKYLLNIPLLGWRTPIYFMIARKVTMVPPGQSSERFTYHVYLEKNDHGHYEVVKEVPTLERVLARLREKFPEADEETLKRRARKFTEKIFPVFLTRETAILKLLQRDLPKKFRHQVPRVITSEPDGQGYTRKLRMKWLRNGRAPLDGRLGDRGRALTQLEFARQSAELLTALHDHVGVMHLDLRLDNFVITDHGVGFVDFGSAVRVGEEFPEASLLCNLFDEMMRTSQIQRMLGKMSESGQVTSEEICSSHGRVDKAVDFFYLAVQINAPLSNPDFPGLVEFDPKSDEAHELSRLTAEILRPADKFRPRFASAQEILKGIQEIEAKLGRSNRSHQL